MLPLFLDVSKKEEKEEITDIGNLAFFLLILIACILNCTKNFDTRIAGQYFKTWNEVTSISMMEISADLIRHLIAQA